ncbi:MAG: hypothetical protein J0H77_11590 [Alphaproteobacteria bacterium]|nr:hypothetical protein [Alphaproteobacteria bacterium]
MATLLARNQDRWSHPLEPVDELSVEVVCDASFADENVEKLSELVSAFDSAGKAGQQIEGRCLGIAVDT